MEDSRPSPEENGSPEDSLTPRKRRGGDFLSQYLLRRRERSGENIEQDDEDEESDEKPKKFRKFFKGLFRKVVEQPERPSEQGGERTSLESLFFAWHDSEKQEAVEMDVESTPVVPTTFEQSSEHSDDIKHEEESLPEPLMMEQRAPVESEAPTMLTEANTTPVAPEASLSASKESISEIPPPEISPNERYLFEQPDSSEARTLPNTTVFERAAPVPAEKEVVIERGPGMVLPIALVGAEYLARKKADRRLDKKFSEKVTTLEKDTKRAEGAERELRELVKQNQEQLTVLKRERGLKTEVRPVAAHEVPDVKRPLERMSRPDTAPRAEGRESKPEVTRVEKASVENMPQTEVVPESYKLMEQVAEAAEKGVAVERVFERSHEVKDDASVPMSATSIGAIIAAQAEEKQRTEKLKALHQQIGDPDEGLPVIHGRYRDDVYRQAVHRGFWAAVVIIIFGTIAFLLK